MSLNPEHKLDQPFLVQELVQPISNPSPNSTNTYWGKWLTLNLT